MKWNVSCRIKNASDAAPIVIIEFDTLKLNKKVFEKKKGGLYMRQCIYAHWLEDACSALKYLDVHVAKIYDHMQNSAPKLAS